MKKLTLYLFALLCSLIISCTKSDFLNVKPDEALIVPQSLTDLQAILDNDQVMNGTSRLPNVFGATPRCGEEASDDSYITSSVRLTSTSKANYLPLYEWDKNVYDLNISNSYNWSYPYRIIYSANLALDGIHKLTSSTTDQVVYNNIKGSALFYRAFEFYHLSQIFAPPFDLNTSESDLGIPLRLTSDINENINRSTVKDTYNRILSDLKEAETLLPNLPLYKTRPSKVAAQAMLSKVYLTMGDYDNAFLYADQCLRIQSALIDYNTIPSAVRYPFAAFNGEVIYHSVMYPSLMVDPSYSSIDSTLYKSYSTNDLRKACFFGDAKVLANNTGVLFKGSYNNNNYFFTGIATDEIYLIRAECYARKGNIVNAMADLNTLMAKRWKTGSFTPFTASNSSTALAIILIERRKELLMRGTRWTDLRRLNKEGANITITRIVDGVPYTLTPNSPRYTYLIPPEVISYNPNMIQNP